MRVWEFAAAITLSSFAVASVAMSLAVGRLGPIAARRLQRYSAASRARLLFRLRMLPAVTALAIAFGLALPIFIVYEPPDTGETLARTLVVMAAAGAAVMLRAVVRALGAWRATARVRRTWQARGRRLDGLGTSLPLFAIDEPFPTVAVVGVRRPVLFVSERVLRECTDGEVRAMLRHEAAHVTVRDNLKRFVLRACPDVVRPGGALDRAWSHAAEEAADAAAAAERPLAAVDLAGALIRVARLAPARTPALASAFYLGGSIESRVRNLLGSATAPAAPMAFARVLPIVAAGFAVLAVAAAPGLHQLMEILVSRLP